MTGRGVAGEIVQDWVEGSNPGTGTSSSGAVDAGMSKRIEFVPGVALASRIACRSDPGPESFVFVTTNVREPPEPSSMIRRTAVGWKSTIDPAEGLDSARFTVLTPPTAAVFRSVIGNVFEVSPGPKTSVP